MSLRLLKSASSICLLHRDDPQTDPLDRHGTWCTSEGSWRWRQPCSLPFCSLRSKDQNCPRNERPLTAPAAWRAQTRSVRSNNITADALIGALATPHANSVSPSLNVGGWVNEIGSYLQDPHYVKLRGGSIGDVIKQCRSISHQQTGASFVAMVTYMQLAIQCRR